MYFSPVCCSGGNDPFPAPVYSFTGLENEGYIYDRGGKGSWSHVNKPGWGADRITLLLSVYHIPPPEYKTRYLSVSALPYASLMPICGIFAICIIFVCLLPRPSPISECLLYLHLSRPWDCISICLSMPATCPQDQPEVMGGDDFKSDDNVGEIEDG